MPRAPRVSVVIPLYNGEAHIAETIDGVLAQTFRDYDLIVIDDGSTDGSPAVVQRYGDRVRYARQTNAGVSAATNTALSLARGDLIAFLDHDDVWLPSKLERQVAFLDAHPECGFVNCDMQYISKSGERVDRYLRGINPADPYVRLFQKDHVIMCSTVMIRRSVYERAGGFDETFLAVGLQEMEWMSRVVECTSPGSVPETLVLYREHEPTVPGDSARCNQGLYLQRLWDRYQADPRKRRFLAGERVAFLSDLGQNEVRSGLVAEGRRHLRDALALAFRERVNVKMVVRSLLRLGRSHQGIPILGTACGHEPKQAVQGRGRKR